MSGGRTNKIQFARFRAAAEHWIEVFGLFDWDLEFLHEKLENKYASVHYDYATRKASLVLSTSFGKWPITEERIQDSALHEVLHLLLADLSGFAEAAAAERRVTEAEHIIINRIKAALNRAHG